MPGLAADWFSLYFYSFICPCVTWIWCGFLCYVSEKQKSVSRMVLISPEEEIKVSYLNPSGSWHPFPCSLVRLKPLFDNRWDEHRVELAVDIFLHPQLGFYYSFQ
ncbi:hypothetical protein GOODEAATRI_027294 [Goodea atripinnis]|uniref:Uncharacterized protein n=1 Tax=Goodea atripinnis TaxID=208336 RepID=A0ABV0MME1_9TELE